MDVILPSIALFLDDAVGFKIEGILTKVYLKYFNRIDFLDFKSWNLICPRVYNHNLEANSWKRKVVKKKISTKVNDIKPDVLMCYELDHVLGEGVGAKVNRGGSAVLIIFSN